MTSMRIGMAVVTVATIGAQAGPVIRTIAVSGQAAPGLKAGVVFGDLSDLRLDTAGRAAFWAELKGTGVTGTNDGSVWSDRSGALALVFREGGAIGAPAGTTWAAVPGPAMAGGRIAMTGSVADPANPAVNLSMVVEDPTLAPVQIAREGVLMPAPLATLPWTGLPSAQVSASGFTSLANGNGNSVWTEIPPSLVAAAGNAAPGGFTFDSLWSPVQNDGGTVAVRGTLRDGAAGTQPIASGLWVDDGSTFELVARSESPAPGTDAGFADFFSQPAIDAQGRLTFSAKLSGLGTGVVNDEGIWSGEPGSLTLRVREGAQAAGCEAGVTYRSLSRRPGVAETGALAFRANLDGAAAGTDRGVWIVSPSGVTTLLARAGAQVPRLPAGVVYAGFDDPALSDAGRVAFVAHLSGPGVTWADNRALMVADAQGGLHPVMRTGDTFAPPVGVPRLVDEIVFDHGAPQSGRGAMVDSGSAVEVGAKLVLRDPALAPAVAYSHALVGARLGCAADLDGDGSVTVLDFTRFLNSYADGNLRECDFDGDGLLNVRDFGAFLNAATEACP